MNVTYTDGRTVTLRVAAYADGVFNLEIHDVEGNEEPIEISEEEAERICDFLDVDLDDPGPVETEVWR